MKRNDTTLPDDPAEKETDELLKIRETHDKRRKKIRRRRRIVIFGILFALVSLYIITNWNSIAPQSITESLENLFSFMGPGRFPQEIPSGNIKTAEPVGSNLAVLSDTALFFYSRSGACLAQRQHGMSNPNLAAAGGKAVLYDRGGKTFRVETRFDEPFSGTTDYPIVTAAVSSSGGIAVATESDTYLSQLSVYDESYKSVFKWYSAQGRVFSMALSPNGEKLAAVLVRAKGGQLSSSVYVFDTGEKKPESVTEYDGNFLISVQYTSNGNIVAVGDTQTVFQTSAGKKLKQYSYGGRKLKCYANEQGSAVLVFGAYGTEVSSEVVSLSSSGETQGSATAAGDIQAVAVSSNRIMALTSQGIWHSGLTCKKPSVIHSGLDKIAIAALKGDVYVFGLQTIQKYSVS